MDGFILVEESHGTDLSDILCNLCSEVISVPYYESEEVGKRYYIHKACGDLPPEMEHELHPGHRLHKTSTSDVGGDGEEENVCYRCSVCPEFVLDIKSALKAFPINHQCHHHPLVPIHDPSESFCCVVCKSPYDHGISYQCNTCPSFRVHQKCASSQTVKRPFHHHDLKLVYPVIPPENHSRRRRLSICRICREEVKQEDFAFHCASSCNYFVHTHNCRPFTLIDGDSMTLMCLIEEEGNVVPASANCVGCLVKISFPYCIHSDYSLDFFLHKFCAELPRVMDHHLHPGHALTLEYSIFTQLCSLCDVPWEGTSYYYCANDSCDFKIDIICAMRTLHSKHEFHNHPLVCSITKPALTCGACDRDSEGINYQCTTCRFWVHQQCASVPKFKTSDGHPHKLKLIYSLPHSLLGDHSRFNCEVCRAEIKPHNWAYHCAGCRYFTHVHNCSDLSREIEEFDYEVALAAAVRLPVANESVSLATLCLMDTNGIETSSRKIPFVDPNETCDLCRDVLAGPCNKCARCKYFLPKSLVELRDPCLFEGYYSMLKDTTVNNCNGFDMCLYKDASDMKVSCSVLPRYVKHEGHNHLLSPTYIEHAPYGKDGTWCNACKKVFSGYGLRCDVCGFTIDMYCALLPGSISHRYDKEHGFKLTYYSVEGVEEYVCDICEEDITTMWFYHCEECDHSIHPRCIWNYHVKFGPFFKIDKYEECNMVSTNSRRTCGICSKKDGSECRYFLTHKSVGNMIHLECIPYVESAVQVEMKIQMFLDNKMETLRVETVDTSVDEE